MGGDLNRLSSEQVVPFRQFLLKIASRCNLACDYCYVYEFGDQSWRGRPRVMQDEVLQAAVARIVEHVHAHAPDDIRVILHGGEPLLAGSAYLDHVAGALRGADLGRTRLDLFLQTNATLLDERFLEVFHRHRVKVGVSLDGSRESNDRHRRYPDRRGSHAAAEAGLALLTQPRHRPLFSGLLGVLDLEADPVTYYEAMVRHRPPALDLLLPLGTWDLPPPGLTPDSAATPYADWLIAVFDRWYTSGAAAPRLRMFDSILELLLGLGTGSERFGLAAIDIVTVETDGAIEQVDTLKVVGDGAPATGLHVATHALDEALLHPGIVARQQGLAALSPECLTCPIVTVCGGGLYTHRYRTGTGFVNRSVYCRDLYRLITYIRDRVQADVDALREGDSLHLRAEGVTGQRPPALRPESQ
jgi:uncharacterized protein